MDESTKLIKNRYDELCAKRDAVNKQIAPINGQIEKLNAVIAEANKELDGLVEQREKVRGGQSWLDLKKQIARLAAALNGHLKTDKPEEFLE